ncbi:hypothetical protein [Cupriavidus pampae]|uniref:Uncharacterized protein n=1 Tax=Cupriavidus pampae TaxID=659251 RepID=A0ABN7Z0C0_9BURK|nr:hypothetical protein [Cupriavidus pampae]CAG9177700.1 hypothetical protein LMG32289_03878 [Cupriavidus pampae]
MTGPQPLSADDLFLTQKAAMAIGLETRRYRVRDWEVIHVRKPGGQWREFNPLHDNSATFEVLVGTYGATTPEAARRLAVEEACRMLDRRT